MEDFRFSIEPESDESVPMLYTGQGDLNYTIPREGIPENLRDAAKAYVEPTKSRINDIQSGNIQLSETEKNFFVSSYQKGIEIVNNK